MATAKYPYLVNLLFFTLFCAAFLLKDATSSRLQVTLHSQPTVHNLLSPKGEGEVSFKDKGRRLLIGSVAPTCTYNECRGCKYKCRAEQVPVEGNDPINSAYHYKCICHR